MGSKLTTQQFIQRATCTHGKRYDYSLVTYTGSDAKVSIICSLHGTFEQRAIDHIKGRGCTLCNERQVLTKETFVERANRMHNAKYLYDNIVYKNVTTKIQIICPEHGVFNQTPKDHLHGYGCDACGGTMKVTTEQFIERAHLLHGLRYDYTDTNLISMNSPVIIICSEHGRFKQRPADHVSGTGCPECGILKQGRYSEEYFHNRPDMKIVPALLYLIEIDQKFCKIGITKQRYVKQRFNNVDFSVTVSVSMPLHEAFCKEQNILNKFLSFRYKTKTLQTLGQAGWTECFPLALVPTLTAEIEAM